MLLSRIKLLIYLPRAEGGECSTMQYLGIGGPPRVRNPHPVKDKKFLKYILCLGQHPPIYYPD